MQQTLGYYLFPPSVHFHRCIESLHLQKKPLRGFCKEQSRLPNYSRLFLFVILSFYSFVSARGLKSGLGASPLPSPPLSLSLSPSISVLMVTCKSLILGELPTSKGVYTPGQDTPCPRLIQVVPMAVQPFQITHTHTHTLTYTLAFVYCWSGFAFFI